MLCVGEITVSLLSSTTVQSDKKKDCLCTAGRLFYTGRIGATLSTNATPRQLLVAGDKGVLSLTSTYFNIYFPLVLL